MAGGDLAPMGRERGSPADLPALRAVLDLERRLTVQQRVIEVTRALATELNTDALLRLITSQASAILEADRATLYLLDRARNELWSRVAEGIEIREIRMPASRGLAGYVATSGTVLNIAEAYSDPRFNPDIDLRSGYRTRTVLCAPIRDPIGEIVGVLQVLNKREGRFDAVDEEALQALGAQAAIALRNAMLMEELDARVQRTELLLSIMRATTAELELDTLLKTILSRITEVMHADRSSLFLVDFKAGELWSRVAEGLEVKEIRIPFDVGIAGEVATTGKMVNVVDAYQDDRFNPEIDRLTGYHTRSILAAPIRDEQGRIIGVVQVLNKLTGIFTEEDEDLLGALASQVCIALDNARLFEEISAMKRYNESILTSMATGVVTINLEGLVTTVNPAARRIFLLESADDARLHFSTVLSRERNERLCLAIERVFASGDPAHLYDARYTTPAGQQVYVNIAVLPLKDAEQQTNGVVLVAEDITQEQRLVTTLSRYVSHQVAERILTQESHTSLGGSRAKVSVLFADIRNYTGLAARASAEEVVYFLNQYFTRMVEVVFRHEGTLDKYIGDALMAVFGAPVAHDDDPYRAVACAIEMRKALWAFNEERAAQGQPPIEVGLGICNGEAVSGNIGSADRMDYTVIGDAVNVASRMEGLTKVYPCKVLFNDGIYEAVKDRFPCVYLGEEYVQGREEPVHVYGISDDWIRYHSHSYHIQEPAPEEP